MLYKKMAIVLIATLGIGVAGCDYSVSGTKRPILAQGGQDTSNDHSAPSESSGDTIVPGKGSGSENANASDAVDSGDATVAGSGDTGGAGGSGTGSNSGATAGSQGTTGGSGTTGSGTGSGTGMGSGTVPQINPTPPTPVSCQIIADCTGDTVCLNHQCVAIQCAQQSDCDPYYNGALNCWNGYCHGCSNMYWDQATMNPGFFKCSEGFCLGTGPTYGAFECSDARVRR